MGGRVKAVRLYIFGAVALGAIAGVSLAAVMKQPSSEAPWIPAIRAIDDALAAGDVSTATRTWSEAYHAARGSRRWEGHLAVADALVRIDRAAGPGKISVARARESYLAALFRARQEGSLEGVLQAAEAFGSLGDGEVAVEALRIAEAVAGRDPGSGVRARLTALRRSWSVPQATAPHEREVLFVEP